MRLTDVVLFGFQLQHQDNECTTNLWMHVPGIGMPCNWRLDFPMGQQCHRAVVCIDKLLPGCPSRRFAELAVPCWPGGGRR